jgi:hypothetical protein
MLAEAQPKPRRRRNEAACGAPVARFGAWVGPLCHTQAIYVVSRTGRSQSPTDLPAVPDAWAVLAVLAGLVSLDHLPKQVLSPAV